MEQKKEKLEETLGKAICAAAALEVFGLIRLHGMEVASVLETEIMRVQTARHEKNKVRRCKVRDQLVPWGWLLSG